MLRVGYHGCGKWGTGGGTTKSPACQLPATRDLRLKPHIAETTAEIWFSGPQERVLATPHPGFSSSFLLESSGSHCLTQTFQPLDLLNLLNQTPPPRVFSVEGLSIAWYSTSRRWREKPCLRERDPPKTSQLTITGRLETQAA